MDGESVDAETHYKRFGVPKLGFRNYWYPAIESRRLRRKPIAVKILGEDIVIYRDQGKLHALDDRCPHRGVRLSLGKCEFPGSGTISCPYHGWTFDGQSGELVAALMEGSDSSIVGKVCVKSYPVAERAGLVFVFVGDMEAPPVEEDLPEFMADPARFFSVSVHADYACNWRGLVDNWPHDHHGPYVHRTSPELLLQPILPFAQKVETEVIDDGKALGLKGIGGIREDDFKGLGRFPRKEWFRFMNPVGRGDMTETETTPALRKYGIRHLVQVRLPGVVVVGRQSGDYCLVQWAVPIDETRTRLFNINNFRRFSRLRQLCQRVHYWAWRRWAHDWVFSNQDKYVLEAYLAGPERLSRTDIGLVAWRRFAGGHARTPPGRGEVTDIRNHERAQRA